MPYVTSVSLLLVKANKTRSASACVMFNKLYHNSGHIAVMGVLEVFFLMGELSTFIVRIV